MYELMDRYWHPLVQEKSDPLVRLIDLIKTPCWYCTSYRVLFVGAGVGGGLSPYMPPWWWLFPIALVVLLVVIERVACQIKPDDPRDE